MAPRKQKRSEHHVVFVRVRKEMAARLRERAKLEGENTSTFVRSLIRRELQAAPHA